MLQLKSTLRLAALAATALALTALAACSENTAPQAEAAPPPPPPAAAPPPPELLGGPPPREFTPMAPIQNPEDLPPAERMRVYGYLKFPHHYNRGWDTPPHHRTHTVIATGHPAPAAKPVATPVAATVPAPVKAAPPVVTAKAAPAPVMQTPIQQLQAAAVGSAKTATLAVPSDLSATKPGKVTLSLPAGLFNAIHDAAVKLGLAKATKHPQVTATLSGDGYIITPNGPQTAPLKAGQPTTFTWQVLPTPNAKGPLSADMSVILKDLKAAESFSLGKLEQTVASVEAAVAAATAKSKTSDGIDLPGFGKVPSKVAIGVIIGVLALLILAIAGRVAADRRAADERRKRHRIMTEADETVTPVVAVAPVAAPEPVVEHVVAEPVAAEPVVEHVVAEPVVAEPAAATVVEHVVAEPVVEPVSAAAATPEPVVEHVTAEVARGETPTVHEESHAMALESV